MRPPLVALFTPAARCGSQRRPAKAQLVRAVRPRVLVVEPRLAAPAKAVDVAQRAGRVRRDEPRPVEAQPLPADEVERERDAEALFRVLGRARGAVVEAEEAGAEREDPQRRAW